jgi:hypothetical protein
LTQIEKGGRLASIDAQLTQSRQGRMWFDEPRVVEIQKVNLQLPKYAF